MDLSPSDAVPTSGETQQQSQHAVEIRFVFLILSWPRPPHRHFCKTVLKCCIVSGRCLWFILLSIGWTFFLSIVHQLRPADIKVVAALGGSSTVSVVTHCKISSLFFFTEIVQERRWRGHISNLQKHAAIDSTNLTSFFFFFFFCVIWHTVCMCVDGKLFGISYLVSMNYELSNHLVIRPITQQW